MICPKCSYQNDDSNYFCTKCGSNLKVAVTEPFIENQAADTYADKAAPETVPAAEPLFAPHNSWNNDYVMSEEEFLKDYLENKTEETGNDNPSRIRFTIPPAPVPKNKTEPANPAEQQVRYGLDNTGDDASEFITSKINERKTMYSEIPSEHRSSRKKGGREKTHPGGSSGGGRGSGLMKFILAGIAILLIIAVVVIGIILHDTGDDDKTKKDSKNKTKTEETKPDAKPEEEPDKESEPKPGNQDIEMVSNSGLERITYDINYSQAEDIEKDGVDFLIKVRNDNDYAVKAIDFSYSVGGDVVKNVLDDSETFYAYGYVKPETEGYMYCHMHVPSGTPKERGEIKIVNAYSTDLAKYNIPEGVITKQHLNGNTDSYDVDIANNNSKPVSANSKIIVVCEGRDDQEYPLEDAWGCGDMKEEVGDHDFASISDAITNAGMTHYGENNYPKVLILDRDMLDVKADE